jgi:hypothetical protein
MRRLLEAFQLAGTVLCAGLTIAIIAASVSAYGGMGSEQVRALLNTNAFGQQLTIANCLKPKHGE